MRLASRFASRLALGLASALLEACLEACPGASGSSFQGLLHGHAFCSAFKACVTGILSVAGGKMVGEEFVREWEKRDGGRKLKKTWWDT